MSTVFFRCDASLSIGSGHVIRCRTLARSLAQRGANTIFICRKQPGDLIELLREEFKVLVLPELPLLPCSNLTSRPLYKSWLGCNQVQDASQTISVVLKSQSSNAKWLVIDHYGIDKTWQKIVRNELTLNTQSPLKILVIDDLADRPHIADILLDPNFYGKITHHRYDRLLASNCHKLLGPKYSLLSEEYPRLRKLIPTRSDLKRVLVYFGGVDKDDFTGQALNILTKGNYLHLSIDVVLGKQSVHQKEIIELVKEHSNIHIYQYLPSLAGLISRADLSIGAGGGTTWERACLKLSSMVVAIAENQIESTKHFCKRTQSPLISKVNFQEEVESNLQLLMTCPSILNTYSTQAGKMTEGLGCDLTSSLMGYSR